MRLMHQTAHRGHQSSPMSVSNRNSVNLLHGQLQDVLGWKIAG